MMLEMTDAQLDRLIVAMRGKGGATGAAAVEGPMGPCGLGKDKLKRPKRWSNWKKDAEDQMRFLGIEESSQKLEPSSLSSGRRR